MEEVVSGETLISIKYVKPLDDYKLFLKFSNNEERIFDVKPLLDKPVFSPLNDIQIFRNVHIIYDYTIAWNDEIDMCPDSLYISSTPISSDHSTVQEN